MLDIVIKNGTVVDGTGRAAFKADVGVLGDRVALVSGSIDQDAARTIDAAGLHLAPGFIDPHTHSDRPLLVDPTAQSKIRQGVTTEVIGTVAIRWLLFRAARSRRCAPGPRRWG
jgi:N-acyl-D-amino-acid deacylase